MTIDKKHIESIFQDKLSFRGQKTLEKYFENQKQNEEVKSVIKDFWIQSKTETTDIPKLEHVYYKLYHTINYKIDKHKINGKISIIAAAIFIISLLIATTTYLYRENNQIYQTYNQQVAFISLNGLRNQFILPDGTTGWLGNNSKLTYNDIQGKRIVDLDGLAFFDVFPSQGKKNPFIIKTPANLDIEVLGTRLNVLSYSWNTTCEIVLEEGKVMLNIPDVGTQNMVPEESVTYNSETKSFEIQKVKNIYDYLAWKDGKLILQDVSLKDACNKLSLFYNVEFDLQAKGLENQKIRLTLENETLEEALNLLRMVSSATFRFSERELIDNNIYSKRKIIIK